MARSAGSLLPTVRKSLCNGSRGSMQAALNFYAAREDTDSEKDESDEEEGEIECSMDTLYSDYLELKEKESEEVWKE